MSKKECKMGQIFLAFSEYLNFNDVDMQVSAKRQTMLNLLKLAKIGLSAL
jgi:hypothetical protein